MNGIKQMISAICTALVCLGVLRIALPESRIKKSVEIAFGLAALLSVLTPIFSVAISDKGGGDIAAGVSIDQAAPTIAIAQRQCVSMAQSVLEALGIKGAQIFVDMDINNKESISINSVKILGISEAEKNNVQQAVAYTLGVPPDLVEVADE